MEGNRPIYLPPPHPRGKRSLEEALARRRSIRNFTPRSLSLEQFSQILWATQGISEPRWQFRTTPSAGATYPLDVFAVCGRDGVENINEGVYRYNSAEHALSLHLEGDLRQELSQSALNEAFIYQAPLNIVLCAEYRRTTCHYGERGERYVHIEVGHAGQNIYLQAVALGLATVAVGAFRDEEVSKVLCLDKDCQPLYIMPVGWSG